MFGLGSNRTVRRLEKDLSEARDTIKRLEDSLTLAYAHVRDQADEIRRLKSELEVAHLTPQAKADIEGAFRRGRVDAMRKLYHWAESGLRQLQRQMEKEDTALNQEQENREKNENTEEQA